MRFYEQNKTALHTLKPATHYALEQFLVECDYLGLDFRVTSALRTQEEQYALYAKGRRGIIGEEKVTWTITSNHTKGMAFDVHAINCSYEQIEKVANRYGLFRDPVLVKIGDLGHFEAFLAIQPPTAPKYTANAIIRRFQRQVKSTQSALQRSRLKQRLDAFLSLP